MEDTPFFYPYPFINHTYEVLHIKNSYDQWDKVLILNYFLNLKLYKSPERQPA